MLHSNTNPLFSPYEHGHIAVQHVFHQAWSPLSTQQVAAGPRQRSLPSELWSDWERTQHWEAWEACCKVAGRAAGMHTESLLNLWTYGQHMLNTTCRKGKGFCQILRTKHLYTTFCASKPIFKTFGLAWSLWLSHVQPRFLSTSKTPTIFPVQYCWTLIWPFCKIQAWDMWSPGGPNHHRWYTNMGVSTNCATPIAG